MKTSDFIYDLPKGLIAQEPLPDRSGARMMVIHRDRGDFEHKRVVDLPDYLDPGDLLVINDTRVMPARIFGHRTDTGGRVELLLLEGKGKENNHDKPQKAPKRESVWKCMYRASRPPRVGTSLLLAAGKLNGKIIETEKEGIVSIRLVSEKPLLDVLEEDGFAPVPPYIKRNSKVEEVDSWKDIDRNRYQTIYARNPGAVAAPTAGLHFTHALLGELEQRGVQRVAVTLHVGPGTFKPVTTERVKDHSMESERYVVSEEAAQTINRVRRTGGRIVAVGSTTVRTLETVKAERGKIVPCS